MKRYLVGAILALIVLLLVTIGLVDRTNQSSSYGTCIVLDKVNVGNGFEITVKVENYSWDDGFRAGVIKFIVPNKQYKAKISDWRGKQIRVGDRIFVRFERGDLSLIPYDFKIQ